MALPEFTMRQLLEAGAHFGHQTHRWNPKMERYIFGARANIHIIDLSQTMPLLHQALVKVREVAASGGRVLFVGTKRQASDPVSIAAKRCAQYYVNHRWLGGTLTNWRTISGSIARLRELEGVLEGGGEQAGRTKKELLQLTRERDKLELSLGGIKDMGGIPGPDVRDRHQQGRHRDPGSAQAQHPGHRHPRHQQRSDRHHLSGAGQRRRGARASALLRPGRRRGAGRADRGSGRHGRRYRRHPKLRSSPLCARAPPTRRPRPKRPPRRNRNSKLAFAGETPAQISAEESPVAEAAAEVYQEG